MKTVTIPGNMKPFWECEINGVKYSYPAGTEQSVPDEVAALIGDNAAEAPVENPPETSEEEIVRLATPIAKEEGAAEAAKAIDAKLEFIIIPAATVLSDTPANITSVLSVAEFDRLAGGIEQQLALRFKYDGKIYQTSTYQTATGGELYFYANVSSEGTVTGIIEVRIYQSTDKVMAEANLTELGAGE